MPLPMQPPIRIIVDGSWIAGGARGAAAITIGDGRVLAVEPAPRHGHRLHALPAFADAHVHLELSDVHGEELDRSTFAAWIGGVVAARRGRGDEAIRAAIEAGAAELLATGTAAIGDVDPTGLALDALRRTPLEGIVHRELLGTPTPAALARLRAELEEDARVATTGRGLRAGLSPHAPYSTGEELYRRAFDWSRALGLRVASHLAENEEEEAFCERGEGPIAALFADRGLAPPAWSRPRARAFERIVALDPPPGFAVIHGHRLRPDELALCAKRGWPLVCCPRSQRYFGHEPRAAERLVAAGGILALGTDSRASNVGLDQWGEMACLRETSRELSDAAILAAATAGGRRALGLEPAELRVGEPATFQLVESREGAPLADGALAAAAVRGELSTRALFVRGRLVAGDADVLPRA
jgi:cytosine/adenosine deaminase-related metal-dependent hydrolase